MKLRKSAVFQEEMGGHSRDTQAHLHAGKCYMKREKETQIFTLPHIIS